MTYDQSLSNIPAPGRGCHAYLLSVANSGILSGISEEKIFSDIRRSIPAGNRNVPDKEIWEAIKKAGSDCKPGTAYIPPDEQHSPTINGSAFFKACSAKGLRIAQEINDLPNDDTHGLLKLLRERSELDIYEWEAELDGPVLVKHLFKPDEYIYIGTQYGFKPHLVSDVLEGAKWRKIEGPLFSPNPYTGKLEKAKSGKDSYRCDAAIARMTYAVVEFDDKSLTIADQLAFWIGVDLPVAALIHSGNKSVHALVKVDCPDYETWQTEVAGKLFDGYFKSMGADASCKNPSRLSRWPGVPREGGERWQQLLYFAPSGKAVMQ